MSIIYNAAVPAANAGFVAAGPFQLSKPLEDLSAFGLQANFTYGSGGTSLDAYWQTSFDQGNTFNDVMHFSFTTANKKRLMNVSAMTSVLAAATPTFHTLTADTAVDGLLGNIWQLWLVIVGTYAASTLRIDTNRRLCAWKAAG